MAYGELTMGSLIMQCLNGNPVSIEFLLGNLNKFNPAHETFILRMGRDLREITEPQD